MKRKSIPCIDVVAGLIWDRPRSSQAKPLIAKRRFTDEQGEVWEFPGGKPKAGESLEENLVCELQEELRIEAAVQGLSMKVKHAYSDL